MSNVWMKTLREENFFGPLSAAAPYDLEEPAWRGDNNEPQFTKSGDPKGRPSWSIGDLVVLYVGGSERTAALLKVTGHPRKSGKDDWPWTTDAEIVTVGGPTLDELGVEHSMVNRRVRWRLTGAQARRARQAFGA